MQNQFTKIMSERSDEQLIEIITSHREKYNSEAIEAAEKEIKSRNIDKSAFDQAEEQLHFQKEEEQRVEKIRPALLQDSVITL